MSSDDLTQEPPEDQLATLRDNYLRGAIDTITFLNALDDLWSGLDNSYAQGRYDFNADGGEPTL